MPVPPGKLISEERRAAVAGKVDDVMLSYPPSVRGKVGQWLAAWLTDTYDTDSLDKWLEVHGASLADIEVTGIG